MELSAREFEVNYELVKGYQVKEIADRLCISPYTVDGHIKKIKYKTGAKNIADMVRNFILSNKKMFLSLMFLTMQINMVLDSVDIERQVKTSRTARAKKGGRRRTKTLS